MAKGTIRLKIYELFHIREDHIVGGAKLDVEIKLTCNGKTQTIAETFTGKIGAVVEEGRARYPYKRAYEFDTEQGIVSGYRNAPEREMDKIHHKQTAVEVTRQGSWVPPFERKEWSEMSPKPTKSPAVHTQMVGRGKRIFNETGPIASLDFESIERRVVADMVIGPPYDSMRGVRYMVYSVRPFNSEAVRYFVFDSKSGREVGHSYQTLGEAKDVARECNHAYEMMLRPKRRSRIIKWISKIKKLVVDTFSKQE